MWWRRSGICRWNALCYASQNNQCRTEPQTYFGNNRGITWYNFVSDQYSGFHGIVIPGTLGL
ncbi:Tn3 family transposase [Klebsiella pneumoniae]|uniref:Tn3 family transposase n=1 Tax=Klebsiella pneumoniae TaxID=573 RepID=UPI00350FA573